MLPLFNYYTTQPLFFCCLTPCLSFEYPVLLLSHALPLYSFESSLLFNPLMPLSFHLWIPNSCNLHEIIMFIICGYTIYTQYATLRILFSPKRGLELILIPIPNHFNHSHQYLHPCSLQELTSLSTQSPIPSIIPNSIHQTTPLACPTTPLVFH